MWSQNATTSRCRRTIALPSLESTDVTSKPTSTNWLAAKHTLAKVAILRAYLQAWFQIMGRTQAGKDVLYIDGFAGPGYYEGNEPGSPIAALEVLKDAIAKMGSAWMVLKVHVVFVEQDRARFEALKRATKPYSNDDHFFVYLFDAPFDSAFEQLVRQVPQFFEQRLPLFAFLDPFGVKGLRFDQVARILESPLSEALINFDADGVGRVFKAGDAADHERILRDVFGTDTWKSALDASQPMQAVVREVLNFYRNCLAALPRVSYTFPFEMRKHTTSIEYYLVFASQHHRGLEKMKEAMRSIDQSGSYQFCDSTTQQTVFRFDCPQDYATGIAAHFAGQTVLLSDIRDYVLVQTPLVKFKGILQSLERGGRLTVQSSDPDRRKRSFKDDQILSVTFTK